MTSEVVGTILSNCVVAYTMLEYYYYPQRKLPPSPPHPRAKGREGTNYAA